MPLIVHFRLSLENRRVRVRSERPPGGPWHSQGEDGLGPVASCIQYLRLADQALFCVAHASQSEYRPGQLKSTVGKFVIYQDQNAGGQPGAPEWPGLRNWLSGCQKD